MSRELAEIEVPRTSVDFEGDGLRGWQKQSVLGYLGLEAALKQLGAQRLDQNTLQSIPIRPIREWILDNWEREFEYDFTKRTIPISFRASLAVSILESHLMRHLEQVGTVEIYAGDSIRQVYQDHDLTPPSGLTTIDYASLPEDVRRELVSPIVHNLYQAEGVSIARRLFPDGVDSLTITTLSPERGMQLRSRGYEVGRFTFDDLEDLDVKAAVAALCLENHSIVGSLDEIMQASREEDKGDSSPTVREDEEDTLLFPEGTTFFDVYPLKEGDTTEDMLRAFRRIAKYGTSFRIEADSEDEAWLSLDQDGTLTLTYQPMYIGQNDGPAIVSNALTQEDEGFYDTLRIKGVRRLVYAIHDELNRTEDAIASARTRYDQTLFTVETGYLEALTGTRQRKASISEIQEDSRLAMEAMKVVGMFRDGDQNEDQEEGMMVYSDHPIDSGTVRLDYGVLRAIKEQYTHSLSDLVLHNMDMVIHSDNIGDWFGQVSGVISRFIDVMVDVTQSYSVLGIDPTNDPDEVQRAYWRVAQETHPDKTSHLPSEEQVEAVERFHDAHTAYGNIMSRIGDIDVDRLRPTFYLGRISEFFRPDS